MDQTNGISTIIVVIIVVVIVGTIVALVWWRLADVIFPGADKATGQRIRLWGSRRKAREARWPPATVIRGYDQPPPPPPPNPTPPRSGGPPVPPTPPPG